MSIGFIRAAALMLSLGLVAPALAQEHGSADEAQALVKKAVAHFKAVGKDKACAAFTDPAGGFQAKDLYVFAQDTNGVVLCHGRAAYASDPLSALRRV
jgi:cytochrome c